MQKFTILIPILNEASIVEKALKDLAESLKKTSLVGAVIVIDAGSRDGTQARASSCCERFGWQFIHGRLEYPSIGKTINQGLCRVSTEYVLVLPIDCAVSAQGWDELRGALGSDYGGFQKQYVPDHLFLRGYGWLQNTLRLAVLGHVVWTNAIFFRKHLISRIPESGFLEDVLLSDSLRAKGRRWIGNGPVLVSARRYLPGRWLRQAAINGFILFLFRSRLCRDFSRLKRLYETWHTKAQNPKMFHVPQPIE